MLLEETLSRPPVRLGINLDHVATLRQARGEFDPDPIAAAHLARLAGADQIVLHVREDRRHANPDDLRRIRELVSVPVNLEMALTPEMEDLALSFAPARVTLVPERREERTTEGGLILTPDYLDNLDRFVSRCARKKIRVSLFLDPDPEVIEQSIGHGVDQVELHTGPYARFFGTDDHHDEWNRLRLAALHLRQNGLIVAAGHGLNLFNLPEILSLPGLQEINIGHNIIARAVLYGMREAVSEIRQVIIHSASRPFE
jgi:pyridoxine 5-phosphate synthase